MGAGEFRASNMKETKILVVSLRDVNNGLWGLPKGDKVKTPIFLVFKVSFLVESLKVLIFYRPQ